MNSYDIIIVGAGSAGLMAARELGKLKYKVLILDRKKDILDFSFNILGSFMNVEDFGLTNEVIAQPLDKAILYSKNLKCVVKGNASILDKRKVHEELIAALDTNFVTLLSNTAVKSFSQDEKGNIISLKDQNGVEYQAKIFIEATGTVGFLSKQIGLQTKTPKLATGVEYNVRYKGKVNEAHLLIGKTYQGGYGWIFPLKNERAIIGFGTFDDAIIKNLKERLDNIIKLPKIAKLVEKDNEKCEGGSIPITDVLEKFVYHNLVCIGDSVSQVNPIVGEGYKFILESAIMAIKAIDKSLKSNNLLLLMEYEEEWKNRFSDNYHFAKKIQQRIFKHSGSDFMVNLGMLVLKIKSNEKVLKVISGEYNRKSKLVKF